jgi:hypothetical protein
MANAKIKSENVKGREILINPNVDGRILNYNLNRLEMWNGSECFSIGSSGRLFFTCLWPIQDREFLDYLNDYQLLNKVPQRRSQFTLRPFVTVDKEQVNPRKLNISAGYRNTDVQSMTIHYLSVRCCKKQGQIALVIMHCDHPQLYRDESPVTSLKYVPSLEGEKVYTVFPQRTPVPERSAFLRAR